jgi:hypothetical protein
MMKTLPVLLLAFSVVSVAMADSPTHDKASSNRFAQDFAAQALKIQPLVGTSSGLVADLDPRKNPSTPGPDSLIPFVAGAVAAFRRRRKAR